MYHLSESLIFLLIICSRALLFVVCYDGQPCYTDGGVPTVGALMPSRTSIITSPWPEYGRLCGRDGFSNVIWSTVQSLHWLYRQQPAKHRLRVYGWSGRLFRISSDATSRTHCAGTAARNSCFGFSLTAGLGVISPCPVEVPPCKSCRCHLAGTSALLRSPHPSDPSLLRL